MTTSASKLQLPDRLHFSYFSSGAFLFLFLSSSPILTFLVLEPELLLHLLAGEVDVAAELGAVQSLRDVMAAILLDEGQELVTSAVRCQRFQNLGEPWGGRDTSQESGERKQNFGDY